MENNTLNPNAPAFVSDSEKTTFQEGLTKREYFAAMAMQGLLTRVPNRPGNQTDLGVLESKRIALEAVVMSNELIKVLTDQEDISQGEYENIQAGN